MTRSRSILRIAAALGLAALLSGCNSLLLLSPPGDVAAQQGNLIVVATVLMLIVIVPVIILTFVFAWRYRASNRKAKYTPDWDHSTQLELVIWGVPLLIIIALGAITWISTHLLDPYRPLERLDANRAVPEGVEPLEIQSSRSTGSGSSSTPSTAWRWSTRPRLRWIARSVSASPHRLS